jgi:hypothetical protein
MRRSRKVISLVAIIANTLLFMVIIYLKIYSTIPIIIANYIIFYINRKRLY